MPENKSLIESLCDLQVPSSIKLSPDGKKVIYCTELSWGHRKGKHDVSNIWFAPTNQARMAVRLTRGTSKDSAPAWSPDGKSIAFISDREAPGETCAIYTQSLTPEIKAYCITASDNKRAIEMFAFSPNGKLIAFLSADEKSQEQLDREKKGEDMQVWGEEWAYTRLRIVDLETRVIKSLNIERHVTNFCWRPDGRQIAFVSCSTTYLEDRFIYGSTISVVDAGLKTVRDLTVLPRVDNTYIQWADDGRLYFRAGVPMEIILGGHAAYALNPSSKNPTYERVAFGIDNDVEGLLKANDKIIAKVDDRLNTKLCVLDGEVLWHGEQEVEAFDAVVTDDENDKITIAFATSDVNHPVEVYCKLSGSADVIQLSYHGLEFRNRQFGTCTPLLCRSVDDKVELDSIYLTPASKGTLTEGEKPGHPLPTVVMIHGGPNTRITNAFDAYYFMWVPYLLSLGYGVLLPNYRGSSGRGEQFASFSIDGVGNYDHADVISLTQNAIVKGFADIDKLIVAGWSQGGFLTFLSSVRNGSHEHGWQFKAAIAGAGISDSDSMALSSDLGCIFQPEINNNRVTWNMNRDDTRNRRASPLWEFSEAIKRSKQMGTMVVPPMLILHGEKDERCHVSQSWGMRRALQSQGLPYEFVTYPRQGHVFIEQKFWIDMALRIGRWCDKYIGDDGRTDDD